MNMLFFWCLTVMQSLVPHSPWENTYVRTASAIAYEAETHPLDDDDAGGYLTAAQMLAFGFTESRYKPDAVDPSGMTYGLFQIERTWAPRAALLSPPESAHWFRELVSQSNQVCASRPAPERYAWYIMGGRGCNPDGFVKSRRRFNLAQRILKDHPIP